MCTSSAGDEVAVFNRWHKNNNVLFCRTQVISAVICNLEIKRCDHDMSIHLLTMWTLSMVQVFHIKTFRRLDSVSGLR
jgi:hypothetical protein